jgi:ABC-type transporter Mla subunit MlaD
MIAGLASALPHTLQSGLISNGADILDEAFEINARLGDRVQQKLDRLEQMLDDLEARRRRYQELQRELDAPVPAS